MTFALPECEQSPAAWRLENWRAIRVSLLSTWRVNKINLHGWVYALETGQEFSRTPGGDEFFPNDFILAPTYHKDRPSL